MINLELWESRKKALGLTYDELSEKSGIPKRTILGVFRKEVLTPRIDTVEAIERALGIGGQTLEWTDEDRAAGVRDTVKITVNANLLEWVELGERIISEKGDDFFDTLKKMLEATVEKS